MKINFKLLLIILSATALVYLVTLTLLSRRSEQVIFDYSKRIANSEAGNYGYQTKIFIDEASYTVKTLAQFFHAYEDIPQMDRRMIYGNLMKNILAENPNFESVWVLGDNLKFDGLDTLYEFTKYGTGTGRLSIHYQRDKNGEILLRDNFTISEPELFEVPFYTVPQNTKSQIVFPPYFKTEQDSIEKQFTTTIATPIFNDGFFICVVGVDLNLEQFQRAIADVQPFGNGFAFLLDNEANIVAHRNKQFIGQPYSEFDSLNYSALKIEDRINNGRAFSYIKTSNGEKYYLSIQPIHIGNSQTNWALATAIPFKTIREEVNRNIQISVVVSSVGLLILAIIIWLVSRNISRPLTYSIKVLRKLSKGEINISTINESKRRDEIGQMVKSVNTLINGLNHTATFAEEIGKGNLEVRYKKLGNNDILGNALVDMQKSLKVAQADEEKRKKDDEIRNWATHGLAKFSELLRQNNDDMEEFSYQLISNLVKYLKANQGGMFLINDEDKENVFIELKAAYAFNQRKFREKKFEVGVTLVGRCVQENQTIYMTDVPKNYIEITSGLGDETPRSLLLVPLKYNFQSYGVLEIASFKSFDSHHINFVERIGESIAATVSIMKINIRTAKLLKEANEQSEQMAMQEEEMRQNMEELLATQEELGRKENNLTKELKAAQQRESDLKRQVEQLRDELDRVHREYARKNRQRYVEDDD